jgi:hypothetical protein
MRTSLACLLALAFPPAQDYGPEIVNARGTYGFLGAERPKAGVLAGDIFFFAFEVKGLKLDADGKAKFSVLTEVLSDKGETVFKEGPHVSVAQNILGGDQLPCAAHMEVPHHIKPGIYTLKIVLEDLATKKSTELQVKGKVLEPDFGLVRVGTFADHKGLVPAAPVGVVGSSLFVHFSLINFQRDKESKQPNLHLAFRILDEKGQPTLKHPLTGTIKDNVAEDAKLVPLEFGFTLNRIGQFTVELTATDTLAKKTAKVTFPLKVTTAK